LFFLGEYCIGIFCHGGTLRCLINKLLGCHDHLTWLISQENTCLNEFTLDGRGWRCEKINDTAHLMKIIHRKQEDINIATNENT
jgi:broad specificity phosphatase PhoE